MKVFFLLEQTISAAAWVTDGAVGRVEHGKELEIPAAFDIAIALANQFPEHVPEQLITSLGLLTASSGDPAAYIDCLKWSLRVEPFKKWENRMRLTKVLVGNQYVNHGFLQYTIYWYHLHDKVRPNVGSSSVAVAAHFKRIYGKQEGLNEHKKYLTLLDAAYPPSPNPPKSPSRN